jgi:hypothetical protein
VRSSCAASADYYGMEEIPKEWLYVLVKKEAINYVNDVE